ncbi:ATP-binding protein [Trichlorobacter lovleyi]|uniref:ATP-binding protein n=1 Tax=Trichlorobacter lovleyi TaxID=313985 RepID=UPI00223ED19E|nr:ATP-binding protein [Trichlorobacter lovleyi]QOX77912.1 ATP-binding protein [Trichlorobacter lovleyi]
MQSTQSVNAFKETTLNHPRLAQTIKKLGLAIRQAELGSLVFVFGPTGVGKSTLAGYMREKLDMELRANGGFDASSLPAAIIEAPYPDAREFSWKEFYRRCLAVLHDPCAHKKVADPRCAAFTWPARLDSRAPGHELRMAFENALLYRKVRVLIIDEAHHIAKGTSAASLTEQLTYIKSLANLTGTVFVMVGTYELLAFRNLSGQVSRRSLDVHFPRYRLDDEQEKRIFHSIVKSFAHILPLPCDVNLHEMMDELYVGSLGCVGLLSGWLLKAVKLAIDDGDGTLRKCNLDDAMYSHDQMNKMIDELLEGEQLLTPPKDSLNLLKTRLGVAGGIGPAKMDVSTEQKKRNPPFTRKPVRDPVGVPA